MKNPPRFIKNIISYIAPFRLPFLTIIYFLLFHYANNVDVVPISDLCKIILPGSGIALAVYTVVICLKYRRQPSKAGIASFVFLMFFLLYGTVFDLLRKIDLFQIEHYSFLPFFILIGVYSSLSIKKVNIKFINSVNLLLFVQLVGLITLNLVKIIPAEIKKENLLNTYPQESVAKPNMESLSSKYPDIYFIILDEAAGFEVIREYFKYDEIDEFVSFLRDSQFYVAENSHVDNYSTLFTMSERLNYQEYPTNAENIDYFEAITQNKVMRYLKQKGYATVVFSELNKPFAYSAMPPIQSDYEFYPVTNDGSVKKDPIIREFGQMIIKNTMLAPFANRILIQNSLYKNHQEMIYFTSEKIGNLDDIPSPKFVYVHLLFPHAPFMFDNTGNLNPLKDFNNYSYYLGQYIFSMDVAKNMITDIMENSNSQVSPIIVLQSDHGARNIIIDSPEEYLLDNYYEKYKTHIINAIRLPECKDAPFSQDMDPINTFPIIFNCYFDAKIRLH